MCTVLSTISQPMPKTRSKANMTLTRMPGAQWATAPTMAAVASAYVLG